MRCVFARPILVYRPFVQGREHIPKADYGTGIPAKGKVGSTSSGSKTAPGLNLLKRFLNPPSLLALVAQNEKKQQSQGREHGNPGKSMVGSISFLVFRALLLPRFLCSVPWFCAFATFWSRCGPPKGKIMQNRGTEQGNRGKPKAGITARPLFRTLVLPRFLCSLPRFCALRALDGSF